MKASGRRIYTRTGDSGETGLLGPSRVRKDHPRIEAVGAVDELSSHLGWARAECEALPELADLAARLAGLQRRLFEVGAELAADPSAAAGALPARVDVGAVEALEREIDELERQLPPLTRFVLPGGSRAASALHVARAVARRAERRVVSLAATEPVRGELLAFMNRLSDLLFVMARLADRRQGREDVTWDPGSAPGSGRPSGQE